MINFVEDLALAGIRFVYFSPAPERESKAYAERLGLEIDWNSCIILSKDTTGKGYHALHDMKAQLPRGVETIRDHIKNVDDVPLQVSLFAECDPQSIAEMIKIYQENGEVVCVIGSSLNDLNVPCFSSADISISVDPICIPSIPKDNTPIPPALVSSLLNSIPCELNLQFGSHLYCVTQMIRDARSLAENSVQAFAFYITLQLTLALTILLSDCALIPNIFNVYQILFIQYVIGPLLMFSIMFTPHLPKIMEQLPSKNADHERDLPGYVYQFAIRCFLPSLWTISLFWILRMEFGLGGLFLTVPVTENAQYGFIQDFVTFFFVIYMVFISSTFVHQHQSLKQRPPTMNIVWTLAAFSR